MSKPISMSSADLNQSDFDAVLEVLKSGRLALGPKTEAFERAMADYVGVPHAVAVSSGTAALHLIVRSLGIGPGDEVIVPSFTFAASVNAILFEGATPVFVDIEPEHYTLCPKEVERKITPRTKAVMAVDVFGQPVDWPALEAICKPKGIAIIDDSCEAIGSEIGGRRIGAWGVAGTFAFYPNKQITTGEGGMITTADAALAESCRSLRNQGRGQMGAWLEHERLGYNYRLDEMSSALGLSQMNRIDEILGKRERVATLYGERLKDFGAIRLPQARPGATMSWFVYVVTLAPGIDRNPVMRSMEAAGIPVRGYFEPLHTQPYVRDRFGDLSGTLPITEDIAQRTVALPFHNHITEEEIDRVAQALQASTQVRHETL